MVTVASGGPGGLAVKLAVGDGDAPAGVAAENQVLAADERGGDVVDPDQIGVVQGDGVAAPDVLRVEVRDVHVLDDDVLGAADHADALALDDALVADPDERFVGLDGDAKDTGLVVLDVHLGRVGLLGVAPAVLVDGSLAAGPSAPGSAAALGSSALGSGEVEGPVKHDDAGLRVAEVGDQLSSGRRVHGAGVATSRDALSKALSGTSDSGHSVCQRRNGGQKRERPHDV